MTNDNATTYGYLIRERVSFRHGNRNYGGRSKTVHVITGGKPFCSPLDIALPSKDKTRADVTCARCRRSLNEQGKDE